MEDYDIMTREEAEKKMEVLRQIFDRPPCAWVYGDGSEWKNGSDGRPGQDGDSPSLRMFCFLAEE